MGRSILTYIKQKAGGGGKVTFMKTIEELYNEINASEELKKAVSEIKDKEAMTEFLKQHGCEASVEEFGKLVESQREGEIEDDAADAAAGGLSIILRHHFEKLK